MFAHTFVLTVQKDQTHTSKPSVIVEKSHTMLNRSINFFKKNNVASKCKKNVKKGVKSLGKLGKAIGFAKLRRSEHVEPENVGDHRSAVEHVDDDFPQIAANWECGEDLKDAEDAVEEPSTEEVKKPKVFSKIKSLFKPVAKVSTMTKTAAKTVKRGAASTMKKGVQTVATPVAKVSTMTKTAAKAVKKGAASTMKKGANSLNHLRKITTVGKKVKASWKAVASMKPARIFTCGMASMQC